MKKTKRIFIRVDEEDLAEIRHHAAASGMKLSAYIRDFSLIPRKSPVLPVDIRKAISGFGRNLNQLAFKANSQGQVEVEEVRKLRQEVGRILETLRR